MNEPFDKTLRNHIRDTFDHFDDGMVDDGWKKFKENKNKKKRGLIFWYSLPSGIAAALALIWLLNLNTFNTEDKKQNPIIANNEGTTTQLKPSKNAEKISVSNSNSKSENIITANAPKLATKKQVEFSAQKTLITAKQKFNIIKPTPAFVVTEKTVNEAIIIENPNQQNISSSNIITPEILAKNDDKPLFETKTITGAKPELTLEEKSIMLANALKTIPENNLNSGKQNSISKNKKKFNVAINANTYYSFTDDGVNNQLNLGLGLATELKIARNLSLNSGISFNRQTTTFAGNQKTIASLGIQSNDLITPIDDSKSTVETTNSSGLTAPEFSYAKLTGFDIPLNLKLAMKMGKAKTFFTTGISSYSVINEKYENDFIVTTVGFTGEETKSLSNTVENPNGKLSSFNFARTLNLSFGVVYPVSKKNSISLEPFLQYPLSGFGYQDLKIGSGGLSFKLNIGN